MDRRKQKPVLISGLPAHRLLRNMVAISAGTGVPLRPEELQMILANADLRKQPLTSREIAAMVDTFAVHFPSIDAASQVVAQIVQKDPEAVSKDHKRYGLSSKRLTLLRRESEEEDRRHLAELGFYGAKADLELELKRIAMAILAASLVQGPDGPGIRMKLPRPPPKKDTTGKTVPSK